MTFSVGGTVVCMTGFEEVLTWVEESGVHSTGKLQSQCHSFLST